MCNTELQYFMQVYMAAFFSKMVYCTK